MSIDPRIRVIRAWMLYAATVLLVASTAAWIAIVCPEFRWWAAMALVPIAIIPCPSCCGAGCDILNDPFTTDNLATDWDDRAGTWAVGSGTLNTTSASALIVSVDELPSGVDGAYVTVDATCATTSDKGQVVALYVDDNNYWFAEVQPGATNGTFKLFHRSGGVDTQRGTTKTLLSFSAGDTATICLGYTLGSVNARASHGSERAAVSYVQSVTSELTQAGCGTGSGSSDVKFDNFIFGKDKQDDPACYYCMGFADCCGNHVPPPQMQLVISDIVNDTGTLCANQNGTFILDKTAGDTACGAPADFNNDCLWVYDDTGIALDVGTLHISFGIGSGVHTVAVQGRGGAFCQTFTSFTETFVGSLCDELSNLDVDASIGFPGGFCMSGGAVECLITSLP